MRATLFTLFVLGATAIAEAQSPRLLTVSAQDDQLRQIDPATGATLASVPMVVTGGISVLQAHGLAVDPTTNKLYAMVSLAPASNKHLLEVDAVTGAAVDVGDTLEKFAGIAFDSTGQLFGISGDGGVVSEALYKIDKVTAAATLLVVLGNGGPGESLGFNPFDGKLYHGSGNGALNDALNGVILETVDPTTLAVTPITLSGGGITGLASLGRDNANTMLTTDFLLSLIHLQTNGTMTVVGALDHLAKGFAWVDGPSFFASYGSGCPGSGGFTPQLAGAGVPNPAQSATLIVSQALGGATGVLFVGLGQGTANVVPTCALQVMPILPQLIVTLPMLGAGPGGGGIALPFTLPANMPPIDVFVQLLVGDPGANGGIASTKPLRMHVQ